MRRVVVSGIGMITPAGTNREETWNNIKNLRCSLSESTIEGTSFNGIINNSFQISLNSKQKRYMDRISQISVLASREAIKDSKLDINSVGGDNMAIFIGTSVGGMETLTQELNESAKHGLEKVSILGLPKLLLNMVGANISIDQNITGGSFTYSSACASGAVAIGEAVNQIRQGRIIAAVAGGSEACVLPQVLESFKRLGALSKSTNLHEASIPFSMKRSGFILSEGTAILVLEELEHAQKRGAKIYAEITGYGNSSDAKSLIAPDTEGIRKCICRALEDAGIKSSDIEYINAHGTATEVNDMIESQVIQDIFGSNPYVSSTKSMIGHTLGAAGAIESALCCLMIKDKLLIPTINLKKEDVDPKVKIHLLLEKSIKYKGGSILSNSFAFGGNNATLVFGPMEL